LGAALLPDFRLLVVDPQHHVIGPELEGLYLSWMLELGLENGSRYSESDLWVPQGEHSARLGVTDASVVGTKRDVKRPGYRRGTPTAPARRVISSLWSI